MIRERVVWCRAASASRSLTSAWLSRTLNGRGTRSGLGKLVISWVVAADYRQAMDHFQYGFSPQLALLKLWRLWKKSQVASSMRTTFF
jgi:hypothetical protein